MYKKGIYSWYRRSNEKDHADIHGALTAYGHTKKDILNVFNLKQGNSIVVFNHLHRPYFEQIYKEQGYKAIVGVSGQLAELKEIDPFIEFTNPYKNDKNIWQEPFTVCQEIEWSYAD
ncbi:hypothetical protein N5853_06320 [Bartonella sp. HY329]|uniref:hypothetical protein n=1 Tax=unclassified Bartonella TaxID=2645622 RepID=UPI0021C64D05|nr:MULTISPECIES: hypothetical protein [unclassified Bartonella]UXM96222.1 hypothetical protein N5853_06320 [Bartonella sp. HY329]UXN10546.1 hypothetical protein N5852_06330 [Bartonella sp. HY328]